MIKKLWVVQKLIETSCEFKNKGDHFAHSLILENYENIIKAYKEKKDRYWNPLLDFDF